MLMNACACMGRQLNPLTGELFPYCPCNMEGLYSESEKILLREQQKKGMLRLEEALKSFIESNKESVLNDHE